MKTIVWDVDDVLNDLMKEWFHQEWLPLHPKCLLKYEELSENPPYKLLDISCDEYLESLDKFRLEKGNKLQPIFEVTDWFEKYGHNFRHAVLTATPLFFTPISSNWVFRHFGKWIRSYNFIPSPRKGNKSPNYDTTKVDFLKKYGMVDIFIDDNEKNFEGIETLGIQGFLVKKPWNNSSKSLSCILQQLINMIEGNEI